MCLQVPLVCTHPIQAASSCLGSTAGAVIVGSGGITFARAIHTMAESRVTGSRKSMVKCDVEGSPGTVRIDSVEAFQAESHEVSTQYIMTYTDPQRSHAVHGMLHIQASFRRPSCHSNGGSQPVPDGRSRTGERIRIRVYLYGSSGAQG